MKQRLNWLWRLFATGFSFTLFGLGGLLLPFYAVPWLLITPKGVKRERKARWLVHINFRFFMNMMRALGILHYYVEDIDRLRQPGQLILANHPSLIDVVLLISLLPQADCVVKSALMKNPSMRGVIRLAGYIANDDPEQVIAEAKASLARGNHLIIFPEGTRTVPGRAISFQRGAANVALRLEQAIRPVLITVEPATLTKQVAWYEIPLSGPFEMVLRVLPERSLPSTEGQPVSLAARQLTKQLEHFFTEELAHYAGTRARA
ncbi:lysophospholipid acyltransferase family protein [Simiduia curdlanivorans]|uniref:Lysophospholipid acyltransferase family protein n=1 Tax=Simiduia curdlanivorans TaxID=1492769 RepID=A0ABV8V4Z1_9GAMM|nr:lysophospholipid acyltransferase family protein [Simiduia curdlanivorans]